MSARLPVVLIMCSGYVLAAAAAAVCDSCRKSGAEDAASLLQAGKPRANQRRSRHAAGMFSRKGRDALKKHDADADCAPWRKDCTGHQYGDVDDNEGASASVGQTKSASAKTEASAKGAQPAKAATEEMMMRTPGNDGRKCGMEGSGSHRVFVLDGRAASTDACMAACVADDSCVGFSGDGNSWCVGCAQVLSTAEPGATAYMKKNWFNEASDLLKEEAKVEEKAADVQGSGEEVAAVEEEKEEPSETEVKTATDGAAKFKVKDTAKPKGKAKASAKRARPKTKKASSEASSHVIVRSEENDGKKCADSSSSSDRVFTITGPDATLPACKAACFADASCVAFSTNDHSWCIGCKQPLSTAVSGGALAYTKKGV